MELAAAGAAVSPNWLAVPCCCCCCLTPSLPYTAAAATAAAAAYQITYGSFGVVWDLGAFGLLSPAQEEAAYLWAELASKVSNSLPASTLLSIPIIWWWPCIALLHASSRYTCFHNEYPITA
jgi:hypothetical protein